MTHVIIINCLSSCSLGLRKPRRLKPFFKQETGDMEGICTQARPCRLLLLPSISSLPPYFLPASLLPSSFPFCSLIKHF